MTINYPQDSEEELLKSLEEDAKDIHIRLQAFRDKVGKYLNHPAPKDIPLKLSLKNEDQPDAITSQILTQLQASLASKQEHKKHACFCYECNSYRCAHSQQEENDEVFTGYSATGRPIWAPFNELLSISEDPKAGDIYSQKNPLLATLNNRNFLTRNQLIGGGLHQREYRIISQVTCGYLNVERERYTLSIQVVENTKQQLFVQRLAKVQLLDALKNDQVNTTLARVEELLRQHKKAIQKVQNQWAKTVNAKSRSPLVAQINRINRKLINHIERASRQKQRRTQHAQQRANEKRPTHKALNECSARGILLRPIQKNDYSEGAQSSHSRFQSRNRKTFDLFHNVKRRIPNPM